MPLLQDKNSLICSPRKLLFPIDEDQNRGVIARVVGGCCAYCLSLCRSSSEYCSVNLSHSWLFQTVIYQSLLRDSSPERYLRSRSRHSRRPLRRCFAFISRRNEHRLCTNTCSTAKVCFLVTICKNCYPSLEVVF